MNRKRIVVGGLVAGLVMNVIDCVVNAGFLGDRYKHYIDIGVFVKEPRLPFMPVWLLFGFTLGIVLAYLYAAVRPRLGPGPKTALVVGLIVGFAWGLPYNFATASWSQVGRFMPMMWAISSMASAIVGALVAGALYKEAG